MENKKMSDLGKKSFDRFTIIIPTYNKPDYLKRILTYFLSFKKRINIIVLDGSDEVFPDISVYEDKIEYLHTPKLDPFERSKLALNKINTPYVLVCADDDFVVPDAVIKVIDFLDNNPDYASGQGVSYSFYYKNHFIEKYSPFWDMNNRKINDNTPSERIINIMSNWILIAYSVFRTEVFKVINENIYFGLKVFRYNTALTELLYNIYTIIEGKHIVLPLLYSAREVAFNSSGYITAFLEEVVYKKKYRQDYQNFLQFTSEYLSKEEKIDIEEARRVIKNAVYCFICIFLPGFYHIPLPRKLKNSLRCMVFVLWMGRSVISILRKIKLDGIFIRIMHKIFRRNDKPLSPDTQDIENWNKIEEYIKKFDFLYKKQSA